MAEEIAPERPWRLPSETFSGDAGAGAAELARQAADEESRHAGSIAAGIDRRALREYLLRDKPGELPEETLEKLGLALGLVMNGVSIPGACKRVGMPVEMLAMIRSEHPRIERRFSSAVETALRTERSRIPGLIRRAQSGDGNVPTSALNAAISGCRVAGEIADKMAERQAPTQEEKEAGAQQLLVPPDTESAPGLPGAQVGAGARP